MELNLLFEMLEDEIDTSDWIEVMECIRNDVFDTDMEKNVC